jgi:hypothetical protein
MAEKLPFLVLPSCPDLHGGAFRSGLLHFLCDSIQFNSVARFAQDSGKSYIQFSRQAEQTDDGFNPILNGRYNAKLWD